MSREPHPPGTFRWAELATRDVAGAKAFFTGRFAALDDPQEGTFSISQLVGEGGS